MLEKNLYSEHWTASGTAEKYKGKFKKKADRIRHKIEVKILKKYAQGDLFDCSIGTGRFIKPLKTLVKTYSGMDYSPAFLIYINQHFPNAKTFQADLEKSTGQSANYYDTTICLRTIFALRNPGFIVSEMKRITQKGGLIIFDYGKKERWHERLKIKVNTANVEKIITDNQLKRMKIFKLDGLLGIVKKSDFLSRAFNSQYNIMPDAIYLLLEKISVLFFCKRKLYILLKI